MSGFHEAAARGRKVAALVLCIQDLAIRSDRTLADTIPTTEAWGDAEWSRVAVQCGQKPPSAITRAAVLDALRARARWENEDPLARCGAVVYRVRYFDRELSRKGQGVQFRTFTDREEAEAFASKNVLHAKPCRVEEVVP
jgi:hypothetical protein